MAKKASSDRDTNNSRTPFYGYVKSVLTEESHEAIDELLAGDIQGALVETFRNLFTWAALGYKISIEFKTDWEEFQVSAYCRHEDDPNYGWILSASGEDGFEAAVTLIYKHQVLYKGGEWTNQGPARRKRR